MFTWRSFGRIILVVAVLATSLGVFYAGADWRGKRAWEKYRATAEARGVILDWSKFIPPPVPDVQNFAMTPFLAPLFDFNPRPLQPGQTSWRDDAATKHAQDFATAVSSLFLSGPRTPWGRILDLNAAVRFIHKKDKEKFTDPPTRTAAANSLIDTLAQFKPVLDELREAGHRPNSRFNISYNDEDPAGILLPHLSILKSAAVALFWRASAELELGQTDAAFDDVHLMIYLANAIRTEPFQISLLVRLASLGLAEQIIWEGLARRQWTGAQLTEFQNHLGGLNFVADLHHSLEAERSAFGIRTFDLIRNHPSYLENVGLYNDAAQAALNWIPAGWVYQEQINYHRFFDERILPGLDSAAAQIHPRVIDEKLLPDPYEGTPQIHPGLMGETAKIPSLNSDGPAARLFHHTVLLHLFFDSAHNWFRKPAQSQTTTDQTVIACALERHRLAIGKLPETLESLAPQFLARVPHDVCNGEPMKYHRVSDQAFALYSVGWNEKDDNGTILTDPSTPTNVDITQGDWVWPPYPMK